MLSLVQCHTALRKHYTTKSPIRPVKLAYSGSTVLHRHATFLKNFSYFSSPHYKMGDGGFCLDTTSLSGTVCLPSGLAAAQAGLSAFVYGETHV